MATAEKNLSNRIRLHAGSNDILAFDVNVGGVKTHDGRYFTTGLPRGFPDLLLITNDGRVIFLEVKTERGILSKQQIMFLNTLRSRKQLAFVVYSFDEYLSIFNNNFKL